MKEAVNVVTNPAAVSAPGKAVKAKGRPRGPATDWGAGASTAAKRLAAAILEVLAGTRTPAEAAQAVGVSLPRYYLLEVRALQGMLVACEPRPLGRQQTAESALAALQRDCEHWRRECTRQQALVRAAQRTIGLSPPAVTKPSPNGSKRRRRRPTARALRAAARLKTETAVVPPAAPAETQGFGGSGTRPLKTDLPLT